MIKLSVEKSVGDKSIKVNIGKDDKNFIVSVEDTLLTDTNIQLAGDLNDLKNLMEGSLLEKTPNSNDLLLGE